MESNNKNYYLFFLFLFFLFGAILVFLFFIQIDKKEAAIVIFQNDELELKNINLGKEVQSSYNINFEIDSSYYQTKIEIINQNENSILIESDFLKEQMKLNNCYQCKVFLTLKRVNFFTFLFNL
ncbi:MAG1140 family protein [Mycoplasmopsis gallinacea]|uniref:Transmembrane protein n=1 Tax=Mycoplasmopsis gallinacea TaxID=29556 RepID=A0A6H0V7E4_9BACT|nr:hypothetical protein [Mycoplasmopsis gallinacea]QIW62415.1 hypothetical protein GOQ20_03255 [Mycoplasmopsis gallinacea]